MSKFKVGDRVKAASWGGVGTVVSIGDYGLTVRIDHLVSDNDSGYVVFTTDELELVVEPKFAVGDTVDYALRGTVNRFLGLSQVVIDTEDGEWIADIDKLTKVTPPFPTRVGSAILALGPAGVENKLYFRVEDDEFIWHSPAANDSYRERDLELISVEYVPND